MSKNEQNRGSTPESQSSLGHGERVKYELSMRFLESTSMNKGDSFMPARLQSEGGRRYADLHLVLDDLEYCVECFRLALEEGNGQDVHSPRFRAFVHSGVIAYGRCFKQGVREVKLDETYVRGEASMASHLRMISLRDKHVAHSVNEMEYSDPVGVMIGRSGGVVEVGPMIGIVKKFTVGVSISDLGILIAHVLALMDKVSEELDTLHSGLHARFLEQLEQAGGRWEMAPIAKNLGAVDVSKRR